MASKDYRRREAKKPKKDAKKSLAPAPIQPTFTVEVIKKKRKTEEEFEE